MKSLRFVRRCPAPDCGELFSSNVRRYCKPCSSDSYRKGMTQPGDVDFVCASCHVSLGPNPKSRYCGQECKRAWTSRRQRQFREARTESGWCPGCGGARDSKRVYCALCRAIHAIEFQIRRAERKVPAPA